MIHQYGAQRSQCLPDGRRVGAIPVGTVVYLQDGQRPLGGFRGPIEHSDPWIVTAWTNRDYSHWNAATRTMDTVRMAGGHLAVVKSLRTGDEKIVADWILLQCEEMGLAA